MPLGVLLSVGDRFIFYKSDTSVSNVNYNAHVILDYQKIPYKNCIYFCYSWVFYFSYMSWLSYKNSIFVLSA